MDISNIIKEKEKSYIYMERYINDGSPSGFSIHTTSKETQPKNGYETFPVKIIEFDETIDVKEIGETHCYALPPRCVFCHPDNIKQQIFHDNREHWREIGNICVSPTASGRTVKCVGEHQFFIKLDYIGMLGRITRNLDLQHLQSAYEVTKIIGDAIDSGKMNKKFAMLCEDYGRIAYLPIGNGEFYELGFVLRSNQIVSANDCGNELFLIPAFSLFGTDIFEPESKPLILQLFEKQNKPINDFAFDDVFKPIIDCYFDVLINCGLCLEAHAQNILVAIDEDYKIRCIVARDFESVDKDLPLREFLGLSNDEITAKTYKCLRKTDYNYQIMHSFMFDFKLGGYLLDPLIEVFKKIGKDFNEENILSKIKALVNDYMKKLPSDYFPLCWYNYANVIHESGKKRPYIAHENPRYR